MSKRSRLNRDNPRCAGPRAVLLLAAASAALGVSGCGALDRDAVQNEISRAASTASEGMLVAREAKRERTWKSFIEIRTAELHGAAEKTEEKLSQPTEEGLGKAADEGSKLAAQVRAALGSLHEHPTDRGLAASVENRLSRLSVELDWIERRL
jgi:hypothetical protein